MSASTYLHVLNALDSTNLTIASMVKCVLLGGPSEARKQTLEESTQITQVLYEHSPDVMRTWAFNLVTQCLQSEVVELTQQRHDLRFNVGQATSAYLEGSFMKIVARKMETYSPHLWELMKHLLDANKLFSRRARNEEPDFEVAEQLGKQDEIRSGGLDGGIADMDTDPEVTTQNFEDEHDDKGQGGTEQGAASRNAVVQTIKAVVCISIFVQSTNKNCNYLQSILGIFYHSTLVPEKVIDLLARTGLSVSVSSINAAIRSLSIEASQKLRDAARTLRMSFAYDNFDMALKVAEPTLQHQSTFISATSATAIPIYGLNNKDDLRCSAQLWARDPNNLDSINPVVKNLDLLDTFHLGIGTVPRIRTHKRSPHTERIAWHVRAILVNRGPPQFAKFKQDLGVPHPINQIPLHQTNQIPCRAMDIKESTQDGNMEVMENLLRQGGLGEAGDKRFNPEVDVDLTEWVLLVHGDLLTKERLDSVKVSRKIEDTPKRRFQYVVFVPGLFHYQMACADAIWRTWVQPVVARTDPNSLLQHVGVLRMGETKKFVSKPGFRMMHQVIHHDIWASMLDCWMLEARSRNAQWATLEDFGKSEPSWETVVTISYAIVDNYVASTKQINQLRDEKHENRDLIFENQILRNRDELEYLELYHALNDGDVGRVEATLLTWIYIFKATGKHKYASQMLEFMFNLANFYPPQLAHIIRLNWLCNPTGKVGGFRGVDWMVERNNLYTKVIYGGVGPNRTLERIIEESILIELFRDCHVTVENGFHLNRTLHHSPPNMTKTLHRLAQEFVKMGHHNFIPGRHARFEAPDQVELGSDHIRNTKETLDTSVASATVDAELDHELEAEDLAVVED